MLGSSGVVMGITVTGAVFARGTMGRGLRSGLDRVGEGLPLWLYDMKIPSSSSIIPPCALASCCSRIHLLEYPLGKGEGEEGVGEATSHAPRPADPGVETEAPLPFGPPSPFPNPEV